MTHLVIARQSGRAYLALSIWTARLTRRAANLARRAKVAGSGLADRFARVEIVSEKDVATYRRVMAAAQVEPQRFLDFPVTRPKRRGGCVQPGATQLRWKEDRHVAQDRGARQRMHRMDDIGTLTGPLFEPQFT